MALIRMIEELPSGCWTLCHGCFDVLHIGHIRHLQAAKRLAPERTHLIVTVTLDGFVNKGPDRPLFTAALRAEALAALECVDYVAINKWPTAVEAIQMLRPSVYVKGPECRTRQSEGLLKEITAVKAVGGRIAFTDDEVWSSTELIRRLRG